MDINNILNNILIHNILPNLDLLSLAASSTVNKRFNKLCNDNVLWNKLIVSHFGEEYDTDTINFIKETYNPKTSKDLYKIVFDMYAYCNFSYTSVEAITKVTKLDYTRSPPEMYNKLLKYTINLEYLRLMYNKMNTLPANICGNNLKGLNVCHNKLSVMPLEIYTMANLTRLNIAFNNITAIPEEFFTNSNMVNLTELDLSGNQLGKLSSGISKLTSLTHLSLNHNKLTVLPTSIGTLGLLSTLNMFSNKFESFPMEICQLVNLAKLFIDCSLRDQCRIHIDNKIDVHFLLD